MLEQHEKTIQELMLENQDNLYTLGQLSVFDARGVEIPCSSCNGFGTKAYGNTTGWRRGRIGGQMLTTDTCDKCWGTGDKYHTGPNLRLLFNLVQEHKKCVKNV